MTETTRKRGRPRDTEVYGDAAGKPLEKLLKRMEGPRIRIDVGGNRVTRKTLGVARKAAGATKAKIDAAQGQIRNSDIDAVIEREERRLARARNAKTRKILATPESIEDVVFDPYSGREEKKESRPSHRQVVRKWKCMDGIHIEQFVRDYEMVGRDLSATSFDPTKVMGSGKPMPFPERKIEAAKRLADLRTFLTPLQYNLVVAVVIYGVDLKRLHAAGGEQHVVARQEVRDAINAMASFYTPGRLARKRTWEAATKLLKDLERLAE